MFSLVLAAVGGLWAPAEGELGLGNWTNHSTVLFVDGNRDSHNKSWACVRGAALVRTPSRSLLALAGGSPTCADGSLGHAVLARVSHDNGTTWSAIATIAEEDGVTGGYVAPMVDTQRGAVLVLYNRKFTETWLVASRDDGQTWSTPKNITTAVGAGNSSVAIALGPPGGVQLPSGRLVMGVHGAAGTFAMFSDDGGDTWVHGSPVLFAAGVANGGESQLVNDGRSNKSLSMTIRVGSHDVLLNHAIAESDDEGATWTVAQVVAGAIGPTCEGSIARRPGGVGGLVISLPHYPRWRYPADRKNMSVLALSRNDTNTTMPTFSVVGEQQIWPGPAAYSGLVADGDYILFEGGTEYRYASVIFAPVGPSFTASDGAAQPHPHSAKTWLARDPA